MTEDDDPFVGKITQKAVLFGPHDEVLVTRVDDRWELPGGTFEYGETLVGGLRRELREEVDLDARVGPPVGALYGGWLDGETGNPMVTLVYRCVTDADPDDVSLNDEHDDYEWVATDEAADRMASTFGVRLERAVGRAAAIEDAPPFEAVTDPYADGRATSEEVLEGLAQARAADGLDDLER